MFDMKHQPIGVNQQTQTAETYVLIDVHLINELLIESSYFQELLVSLSSKGRGHACPGVMAVRAVGVGAGASTCYPRLRRARGMGMHIQHRGEGGH